MSHAPPPIACCLDALTLAERAREGTLLREHLAVATDARALADGYSFRYPADPALFVRLAEWVTLEHRCCPFLDFALDWPRGDATPSLRVTCDEEAKAFVRSTFVPETER